MTDEEIAEYSLDTSTVEYERRGDMMIARVQMSGLTKGQCIRRARRKAVGKIPIRRQNIINTTKLQTGTRFKQRYLITIGEDI